MGPAEGDRMFIEVIQCFNNVYSSTGKWIDEFNGVRRGMTEKLSLRPGAPCDNFQGYCDVFLKCRQVNHILPHFNALSMSLIFRLMPRVLW